MGRAPLPGDFYRDMTVPDEEAVDVGSLYRASHVYDDGRWQRLRRECAQCGRVHNAHGWYVHLASGAIVDDGGYHPAATLPVQ